MSQTDTYRSAVLPSEAAMIPAAEAEETPPPAAEEPQAEKAEVTPEMQAAAETPAKERPYIRTNASVRLERERNRSRELHSADLNWMDAQSAPLGETERRESARAQPIAGQPQVRRTTSGGAALSTLMRSAARRYSPPPEMRIPRETNF